MFMIREVISCKTGKVGALVSKFKAVDEVRQSMGLAPLRIYTDVAGAPFWTLVLEHEYGSLDEFRELESQVMAEERAQAAMAGYHDLITSGHREIYKVEAYL
jgi:hypothetical protein